MHCAAPRTLLPSNPALEIFAALFAIGAALFAAGSWLARHQPLPSAQIPAPLHWTRAVTDSEEELSTAMRLDLIERLAIVGAGWCVDALNAALEEESDPVVREAADRALLVIAAR